MFTTQKENKCYAEYHTIQRNGNGLKCNFQVLLTEHTPLYISERKLYQKYVLEKIKINLTLEWKGYLQPMEIKPVEITASDIFLIMWWGDKLN